MQEVEEGLQGLQLLVEIFTIEALNLYRRNNVKSARFVTYFYFNIFKVLKYNLIDNFDQLVIILVLVLFNFNTIDV